MKYLLLLLLFSMPVHAVDVNYTASWAAPTHRLDNTVIAADEVIVYKFFGGDPSIGNLLDETTNTSLTGVVDLTGDVGEFWIITCIETTCLEGEHLTARKISLSPPNAAAILIINLR